MPTEARIQFVRRDVRAGGAVSVFFVNTVWEGKPFRVRWGVASSCAINATLHLSVSVFAVNVDCINTTWQYTWQ